MKNNRKKTKDDKRYDVITDNSVICKCGHSVFIPSYVTKRLCGWCNRWVYRNKEIEFKEKLQNQLRRKK